MVVAFLKEKGINYRIYRRESEIYKCRKHRSIVRSNNDWNYKMEFICHSKKEQSRSYNDIECIKYRKSMIKIRIAVVPNETLCNTITDDTLSFRRLMS